MSATAVMVLPGALPGPIGSPSGAWPGAKAPRAPDSSLVPVPVLDGLAGAVLVFVPVIS
ncbi:hypothetical protein [Actinoalloteichus spitiensis]|uniref:hypothetical protein n=1 Tax=Actinoalloteichus spitiensis TaxID=252394 RepID=UPI000377D11D|nr:hypothetical protein [Actinoalloteichus spitiensis]